ncbi:MAG: hypothetical protein A2W90_18050 [Bacteroidetes bacterium GWF2_42_66]|nr:MAG: hypothetical protein A2W92_22310 [Bacteroidetes bacterium GWA2_42_15]OFX98155.1 MAG: hypothetical protein A2W89_09540 [Bacteroidetes bacterium GWE2_42_39]OFY42540.1 MAG: hypothetical protein A2W90_18050 [Bacteroidetes bacterium GWF2_42_66]HBL74256.1 hypothetical protein [Prolixibacteraceae bacterium]HCU64025.1 hypothetical protein [Prolixibacteraceae bacterium]
MNQIDLFKYARFPLSAETLDFLQQMAALMSKAVGIGGDNFILSGCVEAGTTVSSGIIVIAGEVMPFVGGTKETYIIIEETKRSVTAEGTVYNEIYIERKARFGTGPAQVEWALFKPVLTIPALDAKIAGVIPSGVVVMWAGTAVPTGWAICDGNNGTPDLRDKFVLAAGPLNASGSTGGNKQIQLTEAQLPAHKHGKGTLGFNDPTWANYLAYNNDTLTDHDSISKGVELKTFEITGETANTGNGDAINIMPPFYALAFIMKL